MEEAQQSETVMAVLVSGTKPFLSRQGSTRHFTGTCPSLVWRPQPITFPPSDVVKPHAVVSVDRTNRQLPRQCCLLNQSRTPTLLRGIGDVFFQVGHYAYLETLP